MRSGHVSIAAAALLALASTVASAKVPVLLVPKLTGTYAINYTEICQGYLSGSTPGSVTVETGTATFSSTTVKIAATKTSGDLVIPKGLVGGTFFQNAVSKQFNYSNDLSKLTIGGVAYNVAYGPSLNQVAQSFLFSGPDGAGCAVSASAILQ
jgi:hypothetical protein